MKRILAHLTFISVLIFSELAGMAFDQSGGRPFEKITPEKAGFSSERLSEVTDYLDKIGSAAFLALHDGKELLSWGHVDRKYWCHSIRKALLNSLYGIYVGRGRIDLNKTIAELDIDDLPPGLTEEEKQARVVDLIRARSGIYHPAAAESEDMTAGRPQRGSHAPGTFFYYNNWDFNVLGTVFERETGERVFAAFEREIAEPLGMRDFRAEDCEYQYEKAKSIHPAYHFRMTARDLALYGLLYQRNGVWEGRQIVPRDWIEVSTKAHSVMDENIGISYGYLWYVLPEDSGFGRAFFHTGVGVHMVMVIPDSRLVIVHRVDTEAPYSITSQNLYELLDLIMKARIQE